MLTTFKRYLVSLLAVCAMISLTGCGDSHEALMEDSVDRMETLVEILEGIEDEDSARAASQQIEDWASSMEESRERFDALDELSSEESAAMMEKFKEQTDALGARMQKQIKRLTMDPKLSAPFAEAMSKVPRAMQAMPK